MNRVLLLAGAMMIGHCCWGQNYLDNFLTGTPVYTTIASSANSVSQPRDLDFKPNTNELWVVNKGSSNGSSVVIVYNAGQSNQVPTSRFDSHAGHFMIYASAIAFGANGQFANTNEIRNTDAPSSTFMGPALWSGDTSIFARVFQNDWEGSKPLGSHLDMLHQSPFSMGIAHDTGTIYWVFDGHNGNLCKYDFQSNHSPGYDDHSNGLIWRYTDVPLTRVTDMPGHMVKDKSSGWLYIIDAGTKKLKRVNTATGTVSGTLSVPASGGENLAGYWSVTGATVQVLDSFNTSQPTGVDYYNGRLIVSDNANGNIHVYNTTGATLVKMGTIATGQSGIMGVRIGPDGNIWFVNNTANTVVRISPAAVPNNDASILQITSPALNNTSASFFNSGFNQCAASITPVVSLQNKGANTLTTATINYRVDNGTVGTYSWSGTLTSGATASVTLPVITVGDGEHLLTAWTSNPNGTADANPANDAKEGSFRTRFPVKSYPFAENFSSPTFPPAGWTYIHHNIHNELSHEASIGSFGANNGTLVMDNFSSPEDIVGQKDYLMMPAVDMSSANNAALLSFSIAYAQYDNTTNDGLAVKVSTNCGATWTQVYSKAGAALMTSAPTSSQFAPAPGEWRTEVVPMSAYKGNNNVTVMFEMTSGHGNMMYLDNVNISTTAGVAGLNADQVSIYPNPSAGKVSVAVKDNSGPVTVSVTDILGKQLQTINTSGAGKYELDLTGEPNGTYFILISSGDKALRQKITLLR
jgi:hypothetical protein